MLFDSHAIILHHPTLTESTQVDPVTFWKEVAYEGTFYPPNAKELKIPYDLLLHWEKTGKEFMADGIDVPVPIEHSEDVEKSRGKAIDWRTCKNSKGLNSLQTLIRFRDEEAAKLAKTTQVSVYSPLSAKLGNGKTYFRPIRHVALTDYPVLPGLEPFQHAIVCSLITAEPIKMSLSSLAEKLQIGIADKEEATLEAEIAAKFADLQRQIEELKKPSGEPTDEPTEVEASLRRTMGGLLRENRTTKIDSLVSTGRITPAVAAELKKTFVSDSAISLSLKTSDTAFDQTFAALSLNEPVASFQSRSGSQSPVPLSSSLNPEDNPMLREAKRRSNAAAANT